MVSEYKNHQLILYAIIMRKIINIEKYMSQDEVFEREKELELNTETKEYEFEGKKYPLKKNHEKEERFIEVDVEECGKFKIYLIESQKQIDIRLQNYNYDFSGYIFICVANFIGAKFTEKAYFSEAEFTKEACFSNAIFTKQAHFLGAIFTKEAYFYDAKFTKEAYFDDAQFNDSVYFMEAQFLRCTSFEFARINSFLIFDEINNEKNELDFSNFKLDLTSTIARNITYSKHNITNVENRNTWLTLKQAAIKQNDNISALEFHKKEMLQYKEDLKKSANKNSKVKESSDIQTIDNKFNNDQDKDIAKDKKEHFISKTFKFICSPLCFIYLLFKCFFEGSKDRGARLILLFEEQASDFGTNAFKSISWILFITLIFEILLYLYIDSYNHTVLISKFNGINIYNYVEQFNTGSANIINSYLYSLNPLNHMKDILLPYMTNSSPDLTSSNIIISIFGIFNFIKNILVGVLIYETIKSFRRFSRKL